MALMRNVRSRLVLMGCALAIVPLAGCTSGSDDDGTTAAPPAPPAAAPDVVKTQLLSLYTDHPISTTDDLGPTNTPAHVWLQTDETHAVFVHWDHDDAAQATRALFVGEAVKGRFCFGDGGIAREAYDDGFVHFHNAVAPNWDVGHNNAGTYDGAVEGWWLRHIGAQDGSMAMMGDTMTIRRGEVFPLMPANAERVQACA